MPNENEITHAYAGGDWADCIMEVLGWFQISGILNPATNNYRPEVNPNGNPVSGPGWVAYEKPSALPGDIVIIYRLTTTLTSGSLPTSNQISSVLWELINPGGLTYWITSAGMKSSVSPTDISSQFPHPGGGLTPANPDNPNGDPDILWRRVTTQYQLPGPGNPSNPTMIRKALPAFGLRTIVWTNSCCVAANLTMIPADPPTIPPTGGIPPPTGEPPTDDPIDVPNGGPTPWGGNNQAGGPSPQPVPGPYGGLSGVNTDDPSPNLVPVDIPSSPGANGDPTPVNYQTHVIVPHINETSAIGSSPPPRRQYGGNTQPDYSKVPTNHPLPWKDKIGEYDYHVATRARPVGTRYLRLTQGGVSSAFLPKRVRWTVGADLETLTSLGLVGHTPREGTRKQVNSEKLKTAPTGREGSRNEPHKNPIVTTPANGPSISGDPVVPTGDGLISNDSTTMGGAQIDKPRALTDVELMTSPRIVRAGNSQYIRSKRRGSVNARKPTKTSSKGLTSKESSGNPGVASLRRRSFDLSRARQSTIAGTSQFTANKMRGPAIRDLRRVKNAPRSSAVLDPSGQFEVRPLVYRGGPNWAYVTIVVGNVQSEKYVVLKQMAYLHTENGTLAANLGTSGVMQFGRVNPVQPGMYVIANPSCLPGQGSLPNVIAGGQTWNLMTLVSTLTTIEGQVIASSTMNFLPAGPNDTDVTAPNRLPVGLMRDLEIQSTADFLYDGTVDEKYPVSADWYLNEPSLVVRRNGGQAESVSIVLKSTTQSQGQNAPFRPLLEIYEDDALQTSGPLVGFVPGPCGALPGWYNPAGNTGSITGQYPGGGGVHTACNGSAGFGGAGGTSSYQVDQFGMIQSGPYNPGVYAGTHECFLYFKYDPSNASSSDSTYISDGSDYRLRIYNNGPATNDNGYVLYTQGLEIVPASASLNVVSGFLQGSITTNHCNHRLKLVNQRTFDEIERRSSWTDGTIILGTGTPIAARLNVQTGDVIKIYRPGYDNQYNSQKVVAEFTI